MKVRATTANLRSVALLAVSVMLSAGALSATAHGQPREDPGPESRRPMRDHPNERQGPPSDGPGLKVLLHRRLDELERQSHRAREAIERLDKGEDPATIAREIWRGGRLLPADDGGRPTQERGNESMGPEQREEMLALIREHMPLLHRRMEDVQRREPVLAGRLLRVLGPRIREAMTVRKSDPELFKLKLTEIQSGGMVIEAVRAYRATLRNADNPSAADRLAEATSDLKAALQAQFDAKVAVQAREIDRLALRLEGMKKDLTEKRARREAEIEETFDQVRQEPRQGKGPPPRPPEGEH